MNKEKFNQLLDELEQNSLDILKKRNALYSVDNDVLHNFRMGAQLDNTTMAQTAWHYMKKHFVKFLDRIETNDWSNREENLETFRDIINYIRFIWVISNESTNESVVPTSEKGVTPQDFLDAMKKNFLKKDIIEDEDEKEKFWREP